MRRFLSGIMMLAMSAGVASANCHGGSTRAWQEYSAFVRETPAEVLATVADITAPVDAFFRDKYPEGRITVDYTRASEAQIAASQEAVIADYKWLQGELVALRERVAARDPNLHSLMWLAQVRLPIIYSADVSDRLLRDELPRLASFKGGSPYAQARYDGVYAACVASLEKAGRYLDKEPGSKDWFALCGQIQPRDKRQDGHMQLTHSILDNLAALMASRGEQRAWWQRFAAN